VENAMKLAQPDRDVLALELRKTRIAEAEQLRQLFYELDINLSGTICIEEFQAHMQSGKLRAYLSVLGLDVKDVEVFLYMLTIENKTGDVEIEAFVDGCMKMKGQATSLDMQTISVAIRMIYKDLKKLHKLISNLRDPLPPQRGPEQVSADNDKQPATHPVQRV